MSNLLEVYKALAEFGRQRAARRAAQAATQTSAADVRVVAGNTSAAGEAQPRERLAVAQV